MALLPPPSPNDAEHPGQVPVETTQHSLLVHVRQCGSQEFPGKGPIVIERGRERERLLPQRLLTEGQVRFARDIENPMALSFAAHRVAAVAAYAAESSENARRAAATITFLQNWYEVLDGRQHILTASDHLARKRQSEREFRERARAKSVSDPWSDVEAVLRKAAPRSAEMFFVSFDFREVFSHAGHLVQLAAEQAKPNGERLAQYRDARLPRILAALKADAPFYPDLEAVLFADFAEQAMAKLGHDHVFVRALLGDDTPAATARKLMQTTRLGDAAERRRLLTGGAAAIAASDDPLIVLARKLDPLMRSTQRFEEEEVAEPLKQAGETLERLRYAVYQPSVAPDATGTLRLSFGVAKGYDWSGPAVPWQTTLYGLHDRAARFGQRPPWNLAPAWQDVHAAAKLATPMNFVLTADIIGGNSGSPVVDRAGDLVGLIFDGNQSSLANDYLYGETTERAVAVHPRLVTYALQHVYSADNVLRELRAP